MALATLNGSVWGQSSGHVSQGPSSRASGVALASAASLEGRKMARDFLAKPVVTGQGPWLEPERGEMELGQKKWFTMRAARGWNGSPTEVVAAPSLEVFEVREDEKKRPQVAPGKVETGY